MIPVSEAFSIVMRNANPTRSIAVDIKNAVGKVIREDIKADREFPPFNRAMMDGIAIRFSDWKKGKTEYQIGAMQPAGSPPQSAEGMESVEIMTGASVHTDFDTVIKYEDLKVEEKGGDKIATINTDDIMQGQNIHPRGVDRKKEEILITKGTLLGPAEIGVVASVGETILQVADCPKCAIISTGDELVDVDAIPEEYQIRKSNSYSIQAALKAFGCDAGLFHFADDSEMIRKELAGIVENFDLVIISGGVSKGKFDFLPEALKDSGVEKLFHKVEQRPGKPFWFGRKKDGAVVFGLPGNPVATFLCYHKYILPWIMKSMGTESKSYTGELSGKFESKIPLTYFLQVKIHSEKGKILCEPIPGHGSGDFANLLEVDGFLEVPPSAGKLHPGETLPLILFRT